jgi:hypothetical protein
MASSSRPVLPFVLFAIAAALVLGICLISLMVQTRAAVSQDARLRSGTPVGQLVVDRTLAREALDVAFRTTPSHHGQARSPSL